MMRVIFACSVFVSRSERIFVHFSASPFPHVELFQNTLPKPYLKLAKESFVSQLGPTSLTHSTEPSRLASMVLLNGTKCPPSAPMSTHRLAPSTMQVIDKSTIEICAPGDLRYSDLGLTVYLLQVLQFHALGPYESLAIMSQHRPKDPRPITRKG